MPQPERRDRRAERHASTKREIINAAWQLSDERGLGGWSLRDVADIVAMRAPSLYVYFESKNALYDAMFTDGYQALLDRIEQTPVAADPVTMLHRAAHVFFDFAIDQPARYFLLFLRTIPGFEPSPDSYRLALESLESLRAVLASAGVVDDAAVYLYWASIYAEPSIRPSSGVPTRRGGQPRRKRRAPSSSQAAPRRPRPNRKS
jgi:AcrR family transcriptional regulator